MQPSSFMVPNTLAHIPHNNNRKRKVSYKNWIVDNPNGGPPFNSMLRTTSHLYSELKTFTFDNGSLLSSLI